ncbi:hypothetical protein [Porphyromonas canoris]|uniref:hypothetical protein n=1 Tax=Porphyromonas canoris TaxID=36875 RepID=UPI00056110F9|nr:hypothetical protein [Porphyromonas canoris]
MASLGWQNGQHRRCVRVLLFFILLLTLSGCRIWNKGKEYNARVKSSERFEELLQEHERNLFLIPSHQLIYPLSEEIDREALSSKLRREYDLYTGRSYSDLVANAQNALDSADYNRASILFQQLVRSDSFPSLKWRASLIGWDVANRTGDRTTEKYFLKKLSFIPFSWEIRAIAGYQQHGKKKRLCPPYVSDRSEESRAYFYIEQLAKSENDSITFLSLWRKDFRETEPALAGKKRDLFGAVSLFSLSAVRDREKEIEKFRSVWGEIFEEDNWFRQYKR